MIVEKDEDTGVWIPSCLTHYIYVNYANKGVNTQKSYAYVICDFLNYLLQQVELGDEEIFENLKSEGLCGVNFMHGAKFLDYLGNDKVKVGKDGKALLDKDGKVVENLNNYETVLRKQNELIYFYDFLYKKGVTSKDMQVEFEVHEKKTSEAFRRKGAKDRGRKVIVNPFDDCGVDIEYPSNNGEKIPKLKDMKEADWELLLEVAEDVTPDIALGVAMQCMGGIRVGEVVNLTTLSYKVDKSKDKLLLSIKDRQNELFTTRGIRTDKSQVKKEREEQPVFDFNKRLFKMLDDHLEHRNGRSNVNTLALFVDGNGNAMTGEVYQRRFAVLKECFLQKLEERRPALAKEYREAFRWGSHIGRHIYTNYLLKKGLCNDSLGTPDARILANLRGDDYIWSSQEYIDNIAVQESIQEKLEQLSGIAVEMKRESKDA